MSASTDDSPAPDVFTWLHVSDWHFKASGNEALQQAIQAIPEPVKKLVAEQNLERGDNGITVNCIIHSGDIANSGKRAEFAAAQVALAKLANDLAVLPENVIITPGNHDVLDEAAFYPAELQRFTNDAEYVAAQEHWLLRGERLRLLLERFKNYHTFKRDGDYPEPAAEEENSWFVRDISAGLAGDRKICLVAVNSALISTRRDQEMRAEMILGRLRIDRIVDELQRKHRNAERHILVLHHPLASLNSRDALRCWDVIENSFDLVLCGHKHGNREIMEHLALASGVPMIDSGRVKPSSTDPKFLEEAEFSVGQIVLGNSPHGRIEITSFAWDRATKSYLRDRKNNQDGVPKERQPLTFPLAYPQRITRNPAAPSIILSGSADLEQHKAHSSAIIENFYLQRDDSKHQAGTGIKREWILPTKHFFWHVESRGLFECMASRHEYWLKTESHKVFREHLTRMVETIGQETVAHDNLLVAVLGVGSGSKETEFYARLKAWRDSKRKATTLLFIDINYQMILRAARRVGLARELRFCNADFDYLNSGHLTRDVDGDSILPTLFLLFGNTFANQFEKALLEQLRSIGENVWLLFDVPLRNMSEEDLKKGYGTDAAKEFKELTLRHFDKRYERKWRMRDSKRIEPNILYEISDVKETATLSNRANSPTFGRLWMGMSHRYKEDKLEEFLTGEHWRIISWPFKQEGSECRYYLVQPDGMYISAATTL